MISRVSTCFQNPKLVVLTRWPIHSIRAVLLPKSGEVEKTGHLPIRSPGKWWVISIIRAWFFCPLSIQQIVMLHSDVDKKSAIQAMGHLYQSLNPIIGLALGLAQNLVPGWTRIIPSAWGEWQLEPLEPSPVGHRLKVDDLGRVQWILGKTAR